MKGRESVTRSFYISNEVRLVINLKSCIFLTPPFSKSVHISMNQLLCVCGCGERKIVELSTGKGIARGRGSGGGAAREGY